VPAQEAPKKISARWLIKKLKTIEERFKGIGCAAALLRIACVPEKGQYCVKKDMAGVSKFQTHAMVTYE
jgi:hypothetical protein